LGQLPAAADLEEFAWRPRPDAEIRVRLPTGDDQRYWLSNPPRDSGWETLATRLVTQLNGQPLPAGWTVPPAWLEEIGSELQRRDPLGNLDLRTPCPECGDELAVEFDLEATLLELLGKEQQRLLDQVHRLASAYHWSEAEIVALPGHRRRYYLSRLEGGATP
jgi:hypothetical protein